MNFERKRRADHVRSHSCRGSWKCFEERILPMEASAMSIATGEVRDWMSEGRLKTHGARRKLSGDKLKIYLGQRGGKERYES